MIPHRTESIWKRALFFVLSLIPVALVGGFFTVRYQIDLYPPDVMEEVIAQLGSISLLYLISLLQTVIYAAVCGFVGYLLADSLGLIKPFQLSKKPLIFTGILSLLGGCALALLDKFVFDPLVEIDLMAGSEAGLTPNGWIASLLYGGIIEEVMLRLFFLTIVAWLLRKLFCKGIPTDALPGWLFWTANIVAALLFAAGHLPATITAFGALTPVLLIRCFLLNGGLALGFGWLYTKHHIGYAMLAHAGVHIVSKILLLLIL